MRLLLGLLVTMSFVSCPARGLTLREAYDLAMLNDASFQVSRYDRDIGLEARIKGRAGLLPSVSANVQTFRNHAAVSNVGANGATYQVHPEYASRSSVVQVRQALYNPDAVARYRQGILQSEQSEIQYRSDASQLALRVVNAYIGIVLADELIALTRSQRETISEQLRTNERLLRNGDGTKTEVLETQARLYQTETDVLDAQDSMEVQKLTLEAMIGTKVDRFQALVEDFKVDAVTSPAFDEWSALVLSSNTELKLEDISVALASEEINKTRAAYLPKLELVGTLSKDSSESVSTYNQASVNRAIGLQLNIPVYSGGATGAAVRQSQAAYARALAVKEVKTKRLLLDLKKDYLLVSNSRGRLRGLEKAVESAEMSIAATQSSIRGGLRTNLDLLSAKQQYLSSRRELIQARADYILGVMRLRSFERTLNLGDIAYVERWFAYSSARQAGGETSFPRQ